MDKVTKHLVSDMSARREELGMTWMELARRSGVTKSSLLAWTAGTRSPNLSGFVCVLKVLGLGLRATK